MTVESSMLRLDMLTKTLVRKAAEFRDKENCLHIRKIGEYSRRLGRLAGLSEKACEILYQAAPMHDIGKIGIPDRILLKPGKLDPQEFETIKTHTLFGAEILSETGNEPVLAASRIIALQHHERWDGSGYPQGLAATGIHIFGRIVLIADVFDTLLSERPYKKAFTVAQAVEEMRAGIGRFFDPALCQLFLDHLDEFLEAKAEIEAIRQPRVWMGSSIPLHVKVTTRGAVS
jgi:putative two-component system response regulator